MKVIRRATVHDDEKCKCKTDEYMEKIAKYYTDDRVFDLIFQCQKCGQILINKRYDS